MTAEPTTKSGREVISEWLNRPLCILLTDGRKVIGTFLCTDNDCNIILGHTHEYWPSDSAKNDGENESETGQGQPETMEEPRLLGLTMVPGKHIVSISVQTLSSQPNVTVVNDESQNASISANNDESSVETAATIVNSENGETETAII